MHAVENFVVKITDLVVRITDLVVRITVLVLSSENSLISDFHYQIFDCIH